MQSYVSRIWKKLIIVAAYILITLLLPGFILVAFTNHLPPSTHEIKDKYVAPDGKQFNLQSFKDNHHIKLIAIPKTIEENYLDDVSFYDYEGRRITLFSALENPQSDSKQFHYIAVGEKNNRGITVTGQYVTGNSYRYSFNDSTYCITKPGGIGTVQMLSHKSLKAGIEEILTSMDILQLRTDLSQTVMWLKVHENTIAISFLLIYALFWLCSNTVACEWAASVKPEPGVRANSYETVKSQIMALNDFDIPFKMIDTGGNTIRAVWKTEQKWQSLFYSNKADMVYEIKMKLKEKDHAVTVMEFRREVIVSKGLISFSKKVKTFRGIVFFAYQINKRYGLSYNAGKLQFTGQEFTLDAQEIKNPLIEIITSNGWSWNPKVLFI